MHTHTLTTLLRLDAAANVAGAIALFAAAAWLAGPIGLGSTWPLWLVAVLFVVNGIENALVARRTTTAGLTGLVAVDLVFAIAVLGIAVTDPTGAETWARWGMAGLAGITAAVGIAKVVGRRSLSTRQRTAELSTGTRTTRTGGARSSNVRG